MKKVVTIILNKDNGFVHETKNKRYFVNDADNLCIFLKNKSTLIEIQVHGGVINTETPKGKPNKK